MHNGYVGRVEGSTAYLTSIRGRFLEVIEVVSAARAALCSDTSVHAYVVEHLMGGAEESARSVHTLSERRGMRDCYIISRSVFESALNVAYIVAEGAEMAERAMRHARQKAVRDYDRESSIGEHSIRLTATGDHIDSSKAHFRRFVEEYTSRKGAEVMDWTEDNIPARLERVYESFGNKVAHPLHLTLMGVYRHSSEIIHGTLFGALFVEDLHNPHHSQQFLASERDARRNAGCALLCFLSALSLGAMVSAVAAHNPQCQPMRDKVSEVLKSFPDRSKPTTSEE